MPSHRTAPRAIGWGRPAVLVAGCYLVLAVVLTWRLWAEPAIRVPADNGGVTPDVYLSSWFMRYAASAVAHGRLPALVSTALNAPQGVNVMWNTSLLVPAVLLAPVTLLAGPAVSLTMLLTLGFAGSATALFAVLRRWGADLWPAAAGGALFGFSPALRQAAMFHYHLQFAALVPLLLDAVLLLATGRGRPARTGVWLGLLAAAQFLTAEEVLTEAAVAAVVLLAVLAASRPAAIAARLRPLAGGAAVAAAVFLALAGYALWTQFRGPLAATGIPWPASRYGNQPADFVTPPAALLLHGQGFTQFVYGTGQRPSEYLGYLGWPLLVLVPAITVAGWRDLRIRVAGLTFVGLELLSIGGRAASVGGLRVWPDALPWHWLQHLPVLSQMLPNRLSIIADGAAAAALAFWLPRLRTASAGRHGRWVTAAAITAGIAAVLPVLPVPLTAAPASAAPPGWTAVIAALRLRPGAQVLQLPMTGAATMAWQAATGADISLVGGYCIAPSAGGQASQCAQPAALTADQESVMLGSNLLAAGMPAAGAPPGRKLRAALAGWHPAALITVAGTRSPLNSYLRRLLGPPAARSGQVLGWRVPGRAPATGPAGTPARPRSHRPAGQSPV
jgi:hypothetical protein